MSEQIEILKTVARRLGIYRYAAATYRAARKSRVYRELDDLIFNSRFGHVRRFDLEVEGIKVAFSLEDDFSRHWFLPRYDGGKLHEPHVTKLMIEELKRTKCFADVGALLGYYSVLAAKLMPSGSVYAFELDSFNHELLTRNLALNGLSNVQAIHAAVADKAGTLRYRRQKNARGGVFKLARHGTSIAESELESAKAVALDDVFSNGVSPDTVKIDVEGAEILVVRGMLRMLESRPPTMFLEVHPNTIQGFGATSQDLFELVRGFGYEMFEIENHKGVGRLKRIDRGPIHNVMTYCLPPGRSRAV